MHSQADRIADLSMLWKQASLVFPYFDQKALDWDQLYRDYLPLVLSAASDREFHLLLARFMNELGDGHTEYLFPRALLDKTGYAPFKLRYVQGAYCLDAVLPAHEAFIHEEINAINGVPFTDYVAQIRPYSYHTDGCLPAWRVQQMLAFLLKKNGNTLSTPKGEFSFDLLPERPQELTSAPVALPDTYQKATQEQLDMRLYENNILYVRLDDMLQQSAADEIRAALDRSPAGLILDLRENVGGMTMYGARIAELLISGQFHACRKRTRSMTGLALASASQLFQWSEEQIAQHIAAGYSSREEVDRSKSLLTNTHFDHYQDTYGAPDHKALFDGPCIALTSRRTVSAAEDFVAMLKTNQRAVILGTPTRGTTGTPLMQELRCGGWTRICSVGYRLLDGTEFIGCGLQPDVFFEMTVGDYKRGYDSVLKEALRMLSN